MASVDRYEIVREIGRGGMATVYLARQADLGRLVALKKLDLVGVGDPARARRFLREARMAGALSHANVVTVYDYLEQDGTPYIAMEYVSGGSLRPHVGAGRTLAQVAGVLDGLLAALTQAQVHGIVHRDLKPENVLVTPEGTVKVTDFGIAKASDRILNSASLTAAGTTIGTPAYMAPEQALGEAVSERTDLYAIGVIAFELLVGHAPFSDTEAAVGVLMRQVNDTIPPVHTMRPDVHPAVSAWIGRLLVKEPRARTASAALARDELDDTMSSLLGPRWLRDAPLPAPGATFAVPVVDGPTPRTHRLEATAPWAPPPMIDATAPLAAAALARTPRAPIPVGAPAAALTRTPREPIPAAAPAPAPAARPRGGGTRWTRAAIAIFALVAVLAALAAAASKSAHSGHSAAPSSPLPATATPAASQQQAGSSGSSTSAPAASQTAPPQAVAPQPQAPQGENSDDGGDDGGTTGGGTGENADDGGDGP
jgi:Protein kinase domain